MKKIFGKESGNKGFTLIEMLVTVICMLLVTEIISLSVQLSTKYYTKSVKNAEAQTICGAISAAVQEELQYATKVQPTASTSFDAEGYYTGFTYYSRARQHGSNSSLVVIDGKVYVQKGGRNYGIVGSETYTYDLVTDLSCRWHPDGYFSVQVDIKDQSDTIATQSFDVYPLNKGF